MKNKYLVVNSSNVAIEVSAAPTRKEALKQVGCTNNQEWKTLRVLGFQVVKIDAL